MRGRSCAKERLKRRRSPQGVPGCWPRVKLDFSMGEQLFIAIYQVFRGFRCNHHRDSSPGVARIYIYIYVYNYIYTCMYIYIYTCMYIYMYIYIFKYIYIYTYIYTHVYSTSSFLVSLSLHQITIKSEFHQLRITLPFHTPHARQEELESLESERTGGFGAISFAVFWDGYPGKNRSRIVWRCFK